ncbi:MAG: hypothetical protein K940chlam9_01362 [Chlamydiae bacterium]|nr:hypothetical protein [Chlamydiota bacterium]
MFCRLFKEANRQPPHAIKPLLPSRILYTPNSIIPNFPLILKFSSLFCKRKYLIQAHVASFFFAEVESYDFLALLVLRALGVVEGDDFDPEVAIGSDDFPSCNALSFNEDVHKVVAELF